MSRVEDGATPGDPLDDFLAAVRTDAHEVVRALAAAIEAAGADFDRRVTYRMLVYTFEQRWHHWVVAIGVSNKVVNLRFLHGRQLDDRAGVLRPGSTTAATADFRTAADVDPELVTSYVREAVEKHPPRS